MFTRVKLTFFSFFWYSFTDKLYRFGSKDKVKLFFSRVKFTFVSTLSVLLPVNTGLENSNFYPTLTPEKRPLK